MATYLFVDELEVTDQEAVQAYIKKAGGMIAAAGGKLLASGPADVLEGSWTPKRCVIVEFPDRAALDAFWNAPEYQSIIPDRQNASDSNIIVVDGV